MFHPNEIHLVWNVGGKILPTSHFLWLERQDLSAAERHALSVQVQRQMENLEVASASKLLTNN